jgi:hypothetical protein
MSGETTAPTPVRVLGVDDDPLVRTGLRLLLGGDDVVLLDIRRATDRGRHRLSVWLPWVP